MHAKTAQIMEKDGPKPCNNADKDKENKDVIIYYNPNINEGLIGIIAARLKDYFNKPSIVITASNKLLKGSARSVYNYNIGRVIKNSLDQKIILNGGGHNMAAGFTLNKENITTELEELELELIDFDVEEVFEDEEGIIIYAPFEQFGALQSYFEENNIEILSSGFERIPTTTVKLNEEQQADVEKLLERLEEDDDVQNVYHSLEM